MKNILIINLKRHGDILSNANLISSLKVHYPQSSISILTYSEFERSAKVINGISRFFSIDRNQILLTSGNKVFSNSLMIKSFYSSISPIMKESWHQVINLSNDEVATNLCSMIKEKNKQTEINGIHFNELNELVHSNFYASVLNEIITDYPYTPYNLVELQHRITDLPFRKGKYLLKTNEKYNQVANQNFRKIRSRVNESKPSAKLVGIHVGTSMAEKDTPIEVLLDFIERLLASPAYHPVLLCSLSPKDIELAKDINAEFSKALIYIESDFKALPAVFNNIDALFTPDTSVKHIADICELPCLEVNYNYVPFFRQGSINPKSLIIAPVDSSYKPEVRTIITADLIFEGLKQIFGEGLNPEHIPSEVSFYKPVVKNNKISYTSVFEHGRKLEFQLEVSRKTLEHIVENKNFGDLSVEVPSAAILRDWIAAEKESIKKSTRLLLHTLRTIMQSKENLNTRKEVGKFLCELIDAIELNSLCSIPLLLFRSEVEKNAGKNSNNFEMLEEKLYQLKTQLQTVSTIVKKIETYNNKSETEKGLGRLYVDL